MRAPKVIQLPTDRPRRPAAAQGGGVLRLFVTAEALLFTAAVSVFMLVRAASGDIWPPAGKPWFSLGITAINSAALLVSGALVLRAGRLAHEPGGRAGTVLLGAIALGAFFLVSQGFQWASLIRRGALAAWSHSGVFFSLIMGLHGAHTLVGLVYLTLAWLGLRAAGQVGTGAGLAPEDPTFLTARTLWYLAAGIWPFLYIFLHA